MVKIEFYREKRFKETKIGEIPEEWKIKKVEEIVKKMKAGGTPKTSVKEYYNGSIPFVKIEDLTSEGKYLRKTRLYISEQGLRNSSAWLVPANALLLAMYGSLGEVSINKIPVTTNQAVLGIVPNEDILTEYLYYWFLYFKPQWIRYAKTTTQANLTKQIVENSLIFFPSLPEQKAVVDVLKNFDDLLEVIEEKIKTLQRIKKGLMEVYFTKGVFEHKEFKDTEIGRIPKNWKVKELGDRKYFEVIMGQSPPSSSYNERGNGIPFLQGSAEFGLIYPVVVKYTTKPLKLAMKGSILLSVRAPVGDVNIADKNYCIGRGLAAIRVKQQINNFFLFYLLSYQKKKLEKLGGGSTFKAVSKQQLENFLIPLPSLEEQKAIAQRLKTVDDQIENLRNQKEVLQKIKKKFMDLLLTGKVRVREV